MSKKKTTNSEYNDSIEEEPSFNSKEKLKSYIETQHIKSEQESIFEKNVKNETKKKKKKNKKKKKTTKQKIETVSKQKQCVWKAKLTKEEEEELPIIFKNVSEEFKEGVEYILELDKHNNNILDVLLEEHTGLPKNIEELSKKSDEMIVQVLISVYSYYDCIDSIKSTNNPFVKKVNRIYHKARMNIIKKQENLS